MVVDKVVQAALSILHKMPRLNIVMHNVSYINGTGRVEKIDIFLGTPPPVKVDLREVDGE